MTPSIPQLLDFAAAHPVVRGEVENQIRSALGITPARYFQLLGRAAASLEGQAYDPITAHRELRRLEEGAAGRRMQAARI